MELFDQNGCLTEEGLHAVIGGQLDELGRLEAAEHLSYCDTGASNGLSDRLQLDYDTVYKVTELTGPDGKVPGSTDSQYEKSAPLYVIFPGHDAQTAAGACRRTIRQQNRYRQTGKAAN